MNYEKQYGRHFSYPVRSPRTGRVVHYSMQTRFAQCRD